MRRQSAVQRAWTKLGVVMLCALASACTATSSDSETEAEALAAIAEFNRQYLAAINTGDLAALEALTTDDHMMISSGGPPLAGKAALVSTMRAAFESFDIEETWAPEETVVSGDLAYQRGTFVVVTTPVAGGDPLRVEGNFLRIYRRQPDGRWLMVRDTFNST